MARLTRNQVRVLVDLARLTGIVVFLLWAKRITADIEKPLEPAVVRAMEEAALQEFRTFEARLAAYRAYEANLLRKGQPPPLKFPLVMNRFGWIEKGMTLRQVDTLLGRPAGNQTRTPEMMEFEARWWNHGRPVLPRDRKWIRWSDPADPNRWAAIVYEQTNQEEETVYGTLKKGF